MKTSMSKFSAVFIPLCCVFALLVFTGTAYAQNCLAQLPAVCQAAPYNLVPGTTGITALGCPNSSTTAAQDQNYAMCIRAAKTHDGVQSSALVIAGERSLRTTECLSWHADQCRKHKLQQLDGR